MPPHPATGGTTPPQNFLPQFLILRPPQKIQIRKKKVLFRWPALNKQAAGLRSRLAGKKCVAGLYKTTQK